MKALLRTELHKLLRRREFWMITIIQLLSFGLPLVLTLTPESYKVNYVFGSSIPQVAYNVIGYAFWEALGVFVILFAILTVGLTSAEIESHYFYLYFPRVNNRGRILGSKLAVLLAFATVWYLIYTVVLNSAGYALFCLVRPDIASGYFTDGSHGYWISVWVLYYFELVFYIFISAILGLKMKPLSAIATVIAVFYGSMFLFDLPLVKFIMPEFYKQRAINSNSLSSLSTTHLYTAAYGAIVVLAAVIMYVLGKKRIDRIEA